MRRLGAYVLPIVLALGASLAWGGSDFVAGLASRRRPLLAVLAGSQLAGLALLLALLAVCGGGLPSAGGAAVAAASGVVELAGFAALYRSLAIGPMALVAPVCSLSALVPLGAALAGGERPTAVAAAGIALALAGVAAAACAREDEAARRRARSGVLLAVAAAVCFGAFAVGVRVAARADGAAWAVALNRTTSVTLLLAAAAATRRRLVLPPAELAAVAGAGVLDAGANALFAFALAHGPASTVSVVGSLYPVTTVALAAMLLRERLAPWQAAGVTAVLAGVALVSA
jgi:drug/metabolite transporter (DMT)-like permease